MTIGNSPFGYAGAYAPIQGSYGTADSFAVASVAGIAGASSADSLAGTADASATGIADPSAVGSVAGTECQTCKERKYQDGSDENVSFKSASHISPEAAGGAVRAHEGEHVANAYSKAAEKGGKVLSATVSIHTAVCPECGRIYVSGGVTNTKIAYSNEENPYVKNLKNMQAEAFKGNHIDVAA
ncbi:hypothetical protein FACS1894111_11860 [Clostridia bacterium]|nr:hypothetical protein FACS1894111_11860 [Clostridia bacterium]